MSEDKSTGNAPQVVGVAQALGALKKGVRAYQAAAQKAHQDLAQLKDSYNHLAAGYFSLVSLLVAKGVVTEEEVRGAMTAELTRMRAMFKKADEDEGSERTETKEVEDEPTGGS